jgi:hypothetical protein
VKHYLYDTDRETPETSIAMSDVDILYDKDFFAWSKQQAEALRSAARTGSNQELDWENLAEEIESLGKSDRRELASRISTIIEHLVKLGHSPAHDPRVGWRQTIHRERVEIERILEDSPSLRREVPQVISNETKHAVDGVIMGLDSRDELSRSLRQALKSKSYLDLVTYTPEQILGDWFPSEPKS